MTAITTNDQEELALVWGPDGDLAFVSQAADSTLLFVMSANGKDQRRIAANGALQSLPDW